MNSNLTKNIKLQVECFIEAPRERVWEAWTDPMQVKEWLGLGVAIESVKIDPRVGGRFWVQIRMADDEFFTMSGTYLEVKPPERLVYTLDWEKDNSGKKFGELEGNESRVTVIFHARAEETQLVVTHENLLSMESYDRHKIGWPIWLEQLTKFIERENR
ncbi:MAG: SRPBCC domain-containing protein [Verrucomicrobiae bacterium]|nr:SRPBCC domain-containing protein [Verrucomicrobiae bacterium]